MGAFASAVVGGLVSGILAPFVLSFLQHLTIWGWQRKLDLKIRIFDDAVRALSLREVDALDPELQNRKQSTGGVVRETEYRLETLEAMGKARSLVRSFFPQDAASAFDKALGCKLGLKEIPNSEFLDAQGIALRKLASDLGIR
jgi:hypothetical protein